MALAGGALAFDQFILTADADTAGVSVDTAATDPVTDLVSRDANGGTPRRGVPLADRFEAVAPDLALDGTASAFGMPKNVRKPAAEPVAALSDDPAVGLRLTSVIARNDGERIAVINGRPLRVGDKIDGAIVVGVDERSVDVETAVGVLTLELARPGLSKSAGG
ncbi:MAG: hypothetical protein AAGF47_00935 [Planctomycetota bacterium]